MIIDFDVIVLSTDAFLVTAIISEGPDIQVGIYEDEEDIEEACRSFEAAYRKALH